jgi:cytochrome c peroxidase
VKSILCIVLVGIACGCSEADVATAVEFGERERGLLQHLSPLGEVPADPTNRFADDPAAARLGHWLFFDERLSLDGQVSCATCHVPTHAFSDPKPLAQGMGLGERHAPSLINVAYGRWFGWGGRADSLWMQALGPLENPLEMGGSRDLIADLIHDDPALKRAYEDIFGPMPDEANVASSDEVFVNVGKSIAAYERLLVRGNSRFDRFAAALASNSPDGIEALSESEQRGLHLFLTKAGCTQCHLGPNFTDSEFHNTAAPPHPDGRTDDPGRFQGIAHLQASEFKASGIHSDDLEGKTAQRVRHLVKNSDSFGAFKTPSLRNLAGREPFMHQGQFKDLGTVLHFYDTREGASVTSHHQEQILRALRLSTSELFDLQSFLGSLEGTALDPPLLVPPTSPLLSD